MNDPSPANDPTQTPPAPSGSGFTLMIAAMALIFSLVAMLAVAFKLNDMHDGPESYAAPHATAMMNGHHVHGSMMGGAYGAAGAPAEGKVQEIEIIVKSDEEHAKRGPEGTWHDAFLPASFTVRPGATVKVTVLNYDEGEHSFTSMPLGVNVDIAAGSATHPKATTFTFRAPSRSGTYLWYCARPCDEWAMAHVGYMRGYVKVA
jgi:plastocyanin